MALTAEEQHELDSLEYEKLLSEKTASHASTAGDHDLTPMQRITALSLGPIGIPAAISGKAPTFQEAKSTLLNSGPTALGAELGSALGPIGTAVGAGVGALAGNIADQFTRPGQDKLQKGELASMTALAMVPGAPLASAGIKGMAREALKQGAAGIAAKTAQTAIDEARLPTGGELTLAGGLPAIGGAIAQKVQSADPAIQKAVADARLKTSVKRQTLEDAQKIGLVAPPSLINPGEKVGPMELAGGPAKVRQQASVINQGAVDDAVRREVQLPPNAPITEGTLQGVREQAGQAYSALGTLSDDDNAIIAVSQVNPEGAQNILDARTNLEALKQARADASGYYKLADRSANPADLKLARSYEKTADELEAKLEEAARLSGRDDLFQDYLAARKLIAKTYTVERALNLGDGSVSAKSLGRALDRGVPLDGDMKTVGKFALAFPKVVQDSTQIAHSGISTAQAGLGALAGTLVGSATHNPAMTVAASVAPALMSSAARNMLLSKPYQNAFARVLNGRIEADPNLLSLILQKGSQSAGQELSPLAP